ncbi:MAG: response regulator [Lachnospiraceae bacterium]|nr:response regulator [Lachnospiraceae bacterium]
MKLLLAEDELELSKPLVAILSHSGYEVDAVFDGEEAFKHISSEGYDGIILDIMMPKMDGIEVLTKTRELGIRTPVLMLTAKSSVEDRVTGLDKGANDYLTKPFAMQELLARIRAMIRVTSYVSESADIEAETLFHCGNVVLDKSGQFIANDETTLHLAGGEITLLEIFMREPDTLHKTDDIITCWSEANKEREPFDINALKLYILYLTRKLDAIHADITIVGNEEEGYSLSFEE